mgnify:CR=1 FL=1
MQISACPHESIASLFKAVSDPTRVRILATILLAGELCGCHIEAALGLTQSRASRHLAVLRRAGLVVDRRDGAWVHYSAPRRPELAIRTTLETVRKVSCADTKIAVVASKAAKLRDASACRQERQGEQA